MTDEDPTRGQTVVLADIGGTHARFAILKGGVVAEPERFEVRHFDGPEAAMRKFLETQHPNPAVTRAVIAAAGPPMQGRIEMTNIGWSLDSAAIETALGLDSVDLMNDFAAQAWAIPALRPESLRAIGGGNALFGAPQAAIGPGTGFGMAVRLSDGGYETIIVTEGGHASLAPQNDQQDQVLRGLRALYGHVSLERVLSGPGLMELYRQLGAAAKLETADIVARGLDNSCPICRATLEMFCALLGSAAGNIAVTTGARGGVYIAGGVVAHFLDFLADSTFRQCFEASGRMQAYRAAIPTWVVTHPDPAFLGLARYVACRP